MAGESTEGTGEAGELTRGDAAKGGMMTDDEALAILSERGDLDNYIAMADDENGVEKPYFRKGSIILRGDFFPDELLAILHFAPKEGV